MLLTTDRHAWNHRRDQCVVTQTPLQNGKITVTVLDPISKRSWSADTDPAGVQTATMLCFQMMRGEFAEGRL